MGPRDGREHPDDDEREAVEGRRNSHEGHPPVRQEGLHRRAAVPGLTVWTRARDLPVAPKETFREWWKRTHKDSDANAPRTDAPAKGLPLASEHGMTTSTTQKEA